MASRGRRYDGEPKLNIKKVIAVLILLIVIIMCIVLIFKFAKQDKKADSKVVTNSYISVYSSGKWGVINSKGETIIDTKYDDMIIIPDPTKAVFIYQNNVDLENGNYDSKAIDDKSNELFTSYDKIEALQNIDNSLKPNGVMCSSVCKVILLCTSPDFTQGIVPFSQYSLLVRDGVEPDFVSLQNSDTVLIEKPSGKINRSLSASVRFISTPLPIFF